MHFLAIESTTVCPICAKFCMEKQNPTTMTVEWQKISSFDNIQDSAPKRYRLQRAINVWAYCYRRGDFLSSRLIGSIHLLEILTLDVGLRVYFLPRDAL